VPIKLAQAAERAVLKAISRYMLAISSDFSREESAFVVELLGRAWL